VIIINDGPVWSIKFHPSESNIEKRIGLLGVATSNQSVLIYSMQYLNNVKSIVLPLEPILVCKLEADDAFFNDDYLLQTTRVAWFQKRDRGTFLAAGYIDGMAAVWNINADDTSENSVLTTLYPIHAIQAHLEPITALDFKATTGTEFHLLTAALDRKLKVFTFDEVRWQETATHYSLSRVLAAEWWMHWPGFLIGFDDCFTYSSFTYRQPLEFGFRNENLLNMSSSITHLNINHWLNVALFVTESGDVIGCHPRQMLQTQHKSKDRWNYYKFGIYSSTDFSKVANGNENEIGIVFCDFKVSTCEISIKILNLFFASFSTAFTKTAEELSSSTHRSYQRTSDQSSLLQSQRVKLSPLCIGL
jgi:hypothetical protein